MLPLALQGQVFRCRRGRLPILPFRACPFRPVLVEKPAFAEVVVKDIDRENAVVSFRSRLSASKTLFRSFFLRFALCSKIFCIFAACKSSWCVG